MKKLTSIGWAMVAGASVLVAALVASAFVYLGTNKPAELSMDAAGNNAEQVAEASVTGEIDSASAKTVVLNVDGEQRKEKTNAETVGEVLKDAGIEPAETDRVSLPLSSPVIDGMGVKVNRVEVKDAEVTEEEIAFERKISEDPEKPEGEVTVTKPGVAGKREIVSDVVVLDGEEVSRVKVSEKTLAEPVAQEESVGTKKAETKPADTSDVGGVWQSLAQCESGGNWAINTGNGYYGGLQFSASSWTGAGGGKYAPTADQATPAQQIEIAENLRANGGWGHWPSCARKLGLL